MTAWLVPFGVAGSRAPRPVRAKWCCRERDWGYAELATDQR
ncbi:hypothetical protein ACIGW1_33015 [Streptomyces sp. NPDC053780]